MLLLISFGEVNAHVGCAPGSLFPAAGADALSVGGCWADGHALDELRMNSSAVRRCINMVSYPSS